MSESEDFDSDFSNEELDELIKNQNRKGESEKETSPQKKSDHGRGTGMKNRVRKPKRPSMKDERKRRGAVGQERQRPSQSPDSVQQNQVQTSSVNEVQVLILLCGEHLTEVCDSLPYGLKKMRLLALRSFLCDLANIDESVLYMVNSQYDNNQGIEGKNRVELDESEYGSEYHENGGEEEISDNIKDIDDDEFIDGEGEEEDFDDELPYDLDDEEIQGMDE